MKHFLSAILTLWASLVQAQSTGVPYFPQTLPAGTIVGRLTTGPGPTEAIPYTNLVALLGSTPWTFPSITVTGLITGGTITTAGTLTGGNIVTGGAVTATGTITGGVITTAGTLTGGNVTTGGTVTAVTVTASGTVTGANIVTGGTATVASTLVASAKSRLTSAADGQWSMTNNAATSFTTLYLGLSTAAFPSLRPTGAGGIGLIAGDGTFYSPLDVGNISVKTAAGVMALEFDTNGHARVGGPPPVLTSCGTTPAVSGTDRAGVVTMGTGTPTGCIITFAAAYAAAPYCIVSWPAQALAAQSYVVAAASITLTQTATSSNKVQYSCIAQSGG